LVINFHVQLVGQSLSTTTQPVVHLLSGESVLARVSLMSRSFLSARELVADSFHAARCIAEITDTPVKLGT
jgi:hypothetical protein